MSLASLPESVFAGLTNLNKLSLQNNSLTTLPASVSGLTNLHELQLDQPPDHLACIDLFRADQSAGTASWQQQI